MERRLFVLWRRRIAKYLLRTGLVETCVYATPADGVKKSGCPQSGDVARVFRIFEANHDMALCTQVVNLVRTDTVDEIDQSTAGGKIAVMQEHTDIGKVWVHINMVYAAGIEGAGATNDSVHFIAFRQKQFSEIGTVLPGDTRDQSTLQKGTSSLSSRRA